MRKLLTVAMAAATLAGGMAWSDTAAAEHRRHYSHHRDRDNTGAVVAAGVLGLALGAAVANNGRYDAPPPRGYYDRPYYGRSYGYAYRPQRCRVVTRWDPYYGRYIRSERCR